MTENHHALKNGQAAPRHGGGGQGEVQYWNTKIRWQGVPQGGQGKNLLQEGKAQKALMRDDRPDRMSYVTMFNGVVFSLLLWIVVFGLLYWFW